VAPKSIVGTVGLASGWASGFWQVGAIAMPAQAAAMSYVISVNYWFLGSGGSFNNAQYRFRFRVNAGADQGITGYWTAPATTDQANASWSSSFTKPAGAAAFNIEIWAETANASNSSGNLMVVGVPT